MEVGNEVRHKNWVLVLYNSVRIISRCNERKTGLGENVVLQLMGCLLQTVSYCTFMDNYFTPFPFHLRTHFGVNNIRATGFSTNIG